MLNKCRRLEKPPCKEVNECEFIKKKHQQAQSNKKEQGTTRQRSTRKPRDDEKLDSASRAGN